MSAPAGSMFQRLTRAIQLSMTARLALVALVSTLLLVAAAFMSHAVFSRQLTRLMVDPQLSSTIDQMMAAARPDDAGRMTFPNAPFDPRYNQGASGFYYQVARIDAGFEVQDTSGSLYDVSIALDGDDIIRLTALEPDGSVVVRYIDVARGPDGWPLRVAGRIATPPGFEGRYLFIVANAPSVTLSQLGQAVAWAFTTFVAFCAMAVAAVTLLQVHIGLQPLRRLQRDVAAVRKGHAERLDGEYAAELAPLANELNALLQHNREVVERARRHVGNLAHALKTPIAVLKNAAGEGGADAHMLKGTVAEMEAFVERQLRRARVAARAEARAGVEAGALGYRTPVKQNLEDLIFMMEQRYEHEKALDISLDAETDVTFRGEREDLLEMAANLIDNACKYGKSQVIVHVTPADAPGGLFEIVVEDDGEGLDDDEIALVLQRGARLDEAAPGQGLGLSILTEAVSLYSGELAFERSALGGLKARLRLPATD